MGAPTGTTTLTSYLAGSAPATFQNKGTLTYSATGDVRTSSASTTYAGASGGGNIFLTSASPALNRNFEIGGINTTGFATFELSFGINRSNVSQTLAELSLQYSLDGTDYVAITVPTVTGATGWSRVTLPNLTFPSSTSLRLRWTNTSAVASGGQQLRLDDVVLTGSGSSGTDTTAPTIATLTPVDDGEDVPIPATLQIRFSEAIAAGTGTISIFKANGDPVGTPLAVSSAAVAISGSTATLTPSVALQNSTSYYVLVTSGAFTDTALNAFTGITDPTTWNFSTVAPDTTGPIAQTFTPANAATAAAVPTSLSVTFNEPVSQTGVSAVTFLKIFKDVAGIPTEVTRIDTNSIGVSIPTPFTTATLSLDGFVLENSTTYTVTLDAGAFLDDALNPSTAVTSWTFTTVAIPELPLAGEYTQSFSEFTSLATLPIGWSITGATTTFSGTWNTASGTGVLAVPATGGILGYQHTGTSGTVVKTLTLKNSTGDVLTDLVLSYNGRAARLADTLATRNAECKVTVNGVEALGFTTADGDNQTRVTGITGLSIAAGATFEIKWTTDRALTGSGPTRHIGLSDISVKKGTLLAAPTLTNSVPVPTLGFSTATLNGNVISDGGSPVTERGFVYSVTATNAAPAIGGTGVTTITDPAPATGAYTTALTGLPGATSYTMSAYAINAVGTSYGTPVIFTTLVTPPSFTGSYTQAFDAYNGSNPAGWTAFSSGGSIGYAGAWANTGTAGGFLGGVSNPGVLGFQHTGGTGMLTTTLTLINTTGATLDTLFISYLGRVARTDNTRPPAFTVSVNDVAVSELAYSTADGVDKTVNSTLNSLGIPAGATFTVKWVSDANVGTGGSRRQIGLADVLVTSTIPQGYNGWKAANAGGQDASGDFDGDGTPNGVEYFYGATGSTFTANPQPINGVITYPRDASATGVTYKVWKSADLVTWTDVTSATTTGSSGVSYTLPTGEGKVFVRLEVVAP
jgi:methionine-rich copper-binding protein CopC